MKTATTSYRDYRIAIATPGKPSVLTESGFSIYGDAESWATKYAKHAPGAVVRIINRRGRVAACYRSDQSGVVTYDSAEMGKDFKV